MNGTDANRIKVNNREGRQAFLDFLRVAATGAVVLMHTLTGAVDAVDITAYPVERLVYLVVMDLITWCVPVFVLISGYLFLNPERYISFPQMLKKYCRRIVMALFLFGVPYAVLELMLMEKTFRLSMIGRGIWMVLQGKSWSHMWYLYLILALYVVTPGLKWLLQRVPSACVYGVLSVLFLGSSVLPFCNKLFESSVPVLPDGGIYFFYYLCGYLFVKKKHVGRKIRTGAAFALAFAIMGGMVLSRVRFGYSLQMAYNYPFTVLLALLLFGAARDWDRKTDERVYSLCRDAGKLSFAVYLIHPVFVNLLYKFLHISLLDFPIGFSLPVFFAGILFCAIVSAWILRKLPWLKKYVL